MLDIKFIRENFLEVKDSVKRRGLKNVDVDKLLEIDSKRLKLLGVVEKLRSELKIDGKPSDEKLAKLQSIKQELETETEKLHKLDVAFNDLLSEVPNLIAEGTPDGDEEANLEIEKWGESKFDFTARDHLELNEINDLFDFEAGAKVAGNKFYFTKDKLVRFWQALVFYCEDMIRAEGFELMMVPNMVNTDIAAGTGYMPKGEENQNYIDEQQGLVMIATSEIPLTGYHKDEVLELDKPKLYGGLSPSYRLEAGAYGKFSKGLYRTHQFEKLEMYVFCKPEESVNWLQKILNIEKKICENLEIPYRVVRIAAGDLSAPAYEKYDVEYYSPAEKEYRELTSCSNCTDYQARNLNIRFRNSEGKLEFAHTLNGTAAVSSRLPIAIMENYQKKDGTIAIPKVLVPFYGGEVL